MKLIISAILVVATTATAQTLYHLPFASTGNSIELVVVNTSGNGAAEVNVSIQNVPACTNCSQAEQTLGSLAAGEEQRALFVFAVDKSAPVGQERRLQFRISTGDGQSWIKEIPIIVGAPETLELFQNYPNPFNPTTTIGYQVPNPSHVTLRVFNLLGQEVARLVEGEQAAGYHQVVWDASVQSSGMYVYEMSLKDPTGRQIRARKTMLVIK